MFVKFGIITEEKFPKYFKLRELLNCGFDYTIEFENVIIITKKQKHVLKNDNGMHNLAGPAIIWNDGYCQYYINGRCMPRWMFEKFAIGTLSRKDFMKEQNEDIRAGIYELIESKGEGSMLEFLGAEELDSKDFLHANGEVENMKLYKTKEKFKD